MAEFVEFQKERALPEYEQMRTLNLFSDEEILNMKKKRENFEYRVTQRSRSLKDFLEYIKYERKLITLTKERIQLQKITTNNTIAMMIATRMKELYVRALRIFPTNTRFWDEYIKFLQQFKFHSDISAAFERMLKFHSDKADVWIRAILWEFNENFQDERVKGLLLRAQQNHPESKQLYLTFFQIELENKRKSEEFLALQHADIVYSNGKKKFKDQIEFFIDMLNIADKFKYANSIQQTIQEDMRLLFPREEIIWHTLAQRELTGLSATDCTMNMDDMVKKEDDDSQPSKPESDPSASVQHTLKKRIELCMQIYDAAVKAVNTTKMWNYYINAMIELNNDLSTQSALKRFALGRAFQEAMESNHMSEDHYLQYIELLHSNNPTDNNIIRVFEKASNTYKTSLKIWLQYLRFYIQADNFKGVQETFKKAKILLGPKGAELWQLYMVYLKTDQNPNTTTEFERLVQELAWQSNAEFHNLKAYVLEMVAVSSGMKRTRKLYELFVKNVPSCYEVHKMMAELESKQIIRDVAAERNCLEKIILNFGQTRTDVWLRYMRFEWNVGDPKKVSRLYDNATSTLNPELLDDFIALYNFFTNGVV